MFVGAEIVAEDLVEPEPLTSKDLSDVEAGKDAEGDVEEEEEEVEEETEEGLKEEKDE